jgi:uncharacterized RDD family membrane protein YckC
MHQTAAATETVYTGFWLRVWAAIIDSVLFMVIIIPLLVSYYGWEYFLSAGLIQGPLDFFLSYVLPALATILFWIYRSATPGKMAIGARIVDAQTGGQPSTGQLIGRYFAYLVSLIPLGLGIFWIGFDSRKQGWHDKLAGTVVVRTRALRPEVAVFHAGAQTGPA